MNKHQHWSNYWQSGMQTSLPQDFKNNYDGEIFQYWQEILADLPDQSRVLDVCTGNGAVALLVAQIAKQHNKQFKINAVDISQINTDYIEKSNPKELTSMIRFVSGQSAETIDTLIKQPQDVIVSQFGIEYSDLSLSGPAIAKSIKPQGRFVMIAHSSTSDVFKYMSKEEKIYQWLQDTGLMSLFSQYGQNAIEPKELINQLHQIIQNHQPDINFKSFSLFQSWLKLVAQVRQFNHQQLLAERQAISEFVKAHHSARKRQQDMLNVVEKLSDRNWYQPFIEAGFKLKQTQDIKYKGSHGLGTCLEFEYMG